MFTYCFGTWMVLEPDGKSLFQTVSIEVIRKHVKELLSSLEDLPSSFTADDKVTTELDGIPVEYRYIEFGGKFVEYSLNGDWALIPITDDVLAALRGIVN